MQICACACVVSGKQLVLLKPSERKPVLIFSDNLEVFRHPISLLLVLFIMQNDFVGLSAARTDLTYLLEWACGRQILIISERCLAAWLTIKNLTWSSGESKSLNDRNPIYWLCCWFTCREFWHRCTEINFYEKKKRNELNACYLLCVTCLYGAEKWSQDVPFPTYGYP